MQQKKSLPNNLELNDLLDALSNEENTVSSKQLNKDYSSFEIHQYFDFFGIQPGIYEVTGKLLHTIYKNWKIESPMGYQEFIKAVSAYISPLKSKKKLAYFRINKKAFKLSEEAIQELTNNEPIKRKKIRRYFTRINHFKNFCKWLGLVSGNDPVRGYVIFYFYDYWTYNFKKKNMGPKTLIEFLIEFIKYKRTSKERFLLIDKTQLNVSQDELQKAQLWADGYAKRQKKSNKKNSKVKKEKTNQEI